MTQEKRQMRPARRRSRRRRLTQAQKRRMWIGGGCAAGLVLLLAALGLFWAFRYEPTREKESYPLEYTQELLDAAGEFELDPCLVAGLVFCESSFRADARSDVGAVGLTQIMPDTGEWLAHKLELEDYAPEQLEDPQTNLRMGCWYLRFLLDRYEGRLQEALTAYIAGQGTVDRWLEDPELSQDGKTLDVIPGSDVKEYAAKVMRMYEKYQEIYGDVLVCGPAGDDADGLRVVRRV